VAAWEKASAYGWHPRGLQAAGTSARFLLHYLRSPAIIGAVVPSSVTLARAMSRLAEGHAHILEFGAGTGTITKQLAHDHGESCLTIFELDGRLARALAQRHPRATVWDRCLHERSGIVLGQPADCVAVSSLPFRSLPASVRRPTIELVEAFLTAHPQRMLVQYTYGLRPPFDVSTPRLAWKRHERVWTNVPPASVWTLRWTVTSAPGGGAAVRSP
jgi:phosphatidylethanolamine/phosphatidyl-N-methylethanolamine N-methyltransferase